MSFISTIPPEQAQGAVSEMYHRQRAAWGVLALRTQRSFSLMA